MVDVRIYQGDTAGRSQERHVAKWAFKHFLRPVDDEDDDKDDDGDEASNCPYISNQDRNDRACYEMARL